PFTFLHLRIGSTASRAGLFQVQTLFWLFDCIESGSISSPSAILALRLHRERFYFKSRLYFGSFTASRVGLFQVQALFWPSDCIEESHALHILSHHSINK